ncbi:MAG: hypothetical protein LBV15_03600, partial [Planctomycetota bacterium]|nr:hypothetical protein [Planctomycetota bacterium]
MEATPHAVPSHDAAPFGVGTILSRAWRTLFSHPALFLGLAVLATAPDLVYEIVFQKSSGIPFSHLLTLMIQGAIAYGVFKITRSEPVSMGEALSRGARRLFTLFLLSLMTSLCVVLGLVLLVIPGLIMLCMFAVSIPACVVEKLGAIDSMKRSAKLTRGRR